MFTAYLWVDGTGFDADAFQRDVGAKFGGSVGSRKRMRDGVVESGPKYWTSRMIPIESGDPEDKLVELLTQLKPELIKLRAVPGVRLVVELVQEIKNLQSVRGVFFSTATLQLLAEMGVGLDIDIVRHVPNKPLSA